MTHDDIISTLSEAEGDLQIAAELLGVTRHELLYTLESDEDLMTTVTDTQNSILLSLARDGLVRSIKKGSTNSILFTMKTLGGLTESINIQGKQMPLVLPDWLSNSDDDHED